MAIAGLLRIGDIEVYSVLRREPGWLSKSEFVSKVMTPETYIIELHFRQLANELDRRFFNSVPTSLQLPSKTVDRRRQLAARELATNEEFKRLVHDLRSNQDNRVRLTQDIPQSQGN